MASFKKLPDTTLKVGATTDVDGVGGLDGNSANVTDNFTDPTTDGALAPKSYVDTADATKITGVGSAVVGNLIQADDTGLTQVSDSGFSPSDFISAQPVTTNELLKSATETGESFEGIDVFSPAARRMTSDFSNLHNYNSIDIGGGKKANGMIEGRDNLVFFLDRDGDSITAYRRKENGELGSSLDIISDGDDLEGVIAGVADDNFLYVVAREGQNVTKVDYSLLLENGSMSVALTNSLGGQPLGIDKDSRGNIYVGLTTGTNRLKIFDSTLTLINEIAVTDGGNGVAIGEDERGDVFCAVTGGGSSVDFINVTDTALLVTMGTYTNTQGYFTQGRAIDVNASKNIIYIISQGGVSLFITLKYTLTYAGGKATTATFDDTTRLFNDFFETSPLMTRRGDVLYLTCKTGVGENGNKGGIAVINTRGDINASASMTTNATGEPGEFALENDGSYRISMDGVQQDILGNNFTGFTTFAEIQAELQTRLQISFPNARVVNVSIDEFNTRFSFISGTTGESSSVSVLSTAASGTDISGSVFLNGTDGALFSVSDPIFIEGFTPVTTDYNNTVEEGLPIGNQLYIANIKDVNTHAWADIIQHELPQITSSYVNSTVLETHNLIINSDIQVEKLPIKFLKQVGTVGVQSRQTGLLNMGEPNLRPVFTGTFTSVGTAVTVTSVDHLLTNGDVVLILPPVDAAYQGVFVITVSTPDIFTYTVLSAPGPQGETGGIYHNQSVNIPGGNGLVVDTSDPNQIKEFLVKWETQDYSPTTLTTQIAKKIFFDKNGVIGQKDDVDWTDEDRRDFIVVCIILAGLPNIITSIRPTPDETSYANQETCDLTDSSFVGGVQGMRLTGNADLTFSIGEGILNKPNLNYHNSKKAPHNVSIAENLTPFFSYGQQALASDFIAVDNNGGNFYNSVIPGMWDNVGVLTTVASNMWTVQPIFTTDAFSGITTLRDLIICYGQREYNTLADAVAAVPTLEFNAQVPLMDLFLVGFFVMKNSTTDLTSSEVALLRALSRNYYNWRQFDQI